MVEFVAQNHDDSARVDSPDQELSLAEKECNPAELLELARASGLCDKVATGLIAYFQSKQFTVFPSEAFKFFFEFAQITQGIDYFKSNAFRYFYDCSDFKTAAKQITENAKYWMELFGGDFFDRSPHDKKKRKLFYQAPIDNTGCYLSCKGGSGMGTFSIDLAIGIDRGQKSSVSGELWRLGMDSQIDSDGERSMRIIRSGTAVSSAKEGFEEKKAVFARFNRDMGIMPQRALGFLAMHLAHDLGAKRMKCVSLKAIRQKNLSLNPSAGVNFDYDKFAQGLGFEENDWMWHQLNDVGGRGFYDALVSEGNDTAGLKRSEMGGFNRILDASRALTAKGCPLTVASIETREEIRQAMRAYLSIRGFFPQYSTPEEN